MANKPTVDYITTDMIAVEIVRLHGNVGQVAHKLEMSRTWVQNRINESPELQVVLSDAREGMVDNAESSLYKNVLAGMESSLFFYLKTQGYKRGYGRQAHYDPDNPAAVGLTVILEDRRGDSGNTPAE